MKKNVVLSIIVLILISFTFSSYALPSKKEVQEELNTIKNHKIKDNESYYFKGEGIDKSDKNKAFEKAEKHAFKKASKAIKTEVEVLSKKNTTIQNINGDETIKTVIESYIKIKSHSKIEGAIVSQKVFYSNNGNIYCYLLLKVPRKEIEATRKAIDEYIKKSATALSKKNYNFAVQFLEAAIELDDEYLPTYIKLIEALHYRFKVENKYEDLVKMCDLLCKLQIKSHKQKINTYDHKIANFRYKVTNAMQLTNPNNKCGECYEYNYYPSIIGGATIPLDTSSDAAKTRFNIHIGLYAKFLKNISFGALIGFDRYSSQDDIRPSKLSVIPIAGLAKYDIEIDDTFSVFGEFAFGINISFLKMEQYYSLKEENKSTLSLYSAIRTGFEMKVIPALGIHIGLGYTYTSYDGSPLHGIFIGGGSSYYF